MKKIAVVGKDGFIGEELFNFLSQAPDLNVIGTTINTLNITDSIAVADFIKNEKCDVIILLAGSKNIKELESNPDYGYNINVKPVKHFISNINKEKLIYFSSDYVFNGLKSGGKYSDTDAVCPNTVYGHNKADAEKIVQNSNINYAIVRTAAVLGPKSVFLSWLVNTLTNEKNVEMYSDSYFTPTCISFLCKAIKEVIYDNKNRIYHLVQEQRLSRFELACIVKSILKSDCKIKPINKSYEDRSLIQSDIIKSITDKPFEDYLKDELCTKL